MTLYDDQLDAPYQREMAARYEEEALHECAEAELNAEGFDWPDDEEQREAAIEERMDVILDRLHDLSELENDRADERAMDFV